MRPIVLALYVLLSIAAMATVDCHWWRRHEEYRAAVYEHPVILFDPPATTRKQAVDHMMTNLKSYTETAAKAGQKNVDILVFPEDGVYGYNLNKRSDMALYLEPMPDPKLVTWNPCDHPSRYPNSDVQAFISCLAKQHNMYVVANIGDVQKCSSADPACPKDGQYQYNTAVAYDRRGNFIAKYHKQDMYKEDQFNFPIHPEHVYFDTDFGARIGLFICFDAVYYEPAVFLIEKYGITDVAFPTAWKDESPYFIAMGYFFGFAVLHGVNFLAANLRNPKYNLHGSGIFTPYGPKKYVHNTQSPLGQLVITDVRKVHRSRPARKNDLMTLGPRKMRYLVKPDFKSVTYYDWFEYAQLTKPEGKLTICSYGFCCYLNYAMQQQTGDLYALGIFNGIHREIGPYYIQVCGIMKCKDSNPQSCGKDTFTASTKFKKFHLKGNFQTKYVYPQIVLSEGDHLALPTWGTWKFGRGALKGTATQNPLLVALLFGRVFNKDGVGNASGKPT